MAPGVATPLMDLNAKLQEFLSEAEDCDLIRKFATDFIARRDQGKTPALS
jgi:hypothetical protein